jgi:flagellar motility protein MotE (MotC chaperone)
MIKLRPLPATIVLMVSLTAVKTAGMVQAISIGSPARANTSEHAPDAKPAHDEKPVQTERKPTAAEPPAPTPPPEPQISDAERAALQDLRARRTQIEAQSAKLDEREALLSASERRLGERVQQLQALQTKLEQLDKERHEREEANWRGLVKTYESMRPRDAAVIFNDLDSAVLIPVLDRMKEAKAAPILAAMAPERARAATTQLAQWRTQVSAAPHLAGSEEAHK